MCSSCEEVPTHHRCKHVVTSGGIFDEGSQRRICGEYICAPCSESFGTEEGVFRCYEHGPDTGGSDSDDELLQKEVFSKKSSKKKAASKASNKGATNSSEGGKVGVKSAEYSAKDILVLAQAFIRVSENAIDGTSQKRNKFWDDVAASFKKLKVQQEAYDSRQKKKEKYNKVRLYGEDFSEDDDDSVAVLMTIRTPNSLQQKWSKSVQPLVTKFISLTNRHPKKSGEGKKHICFFIIIVTFT
jgi:hypothetical protein